MWVGVGVHVAGVLHGLEAGYPRHRETGKKIKRAKKNPCQGKHREF